MLSFVNAKINIGLDIVAKREDGYHLLQTVFYPVGRYAGMPRNPQPFCDIIELTPGLPADTSRYYLSRGIAYHLGGNALDCQPADNLVVKAGNLFISTLEQRGESLPGSGFTLRMEKHLPSGAGMGGGSADAVAVLRLLNDALPKEEVRFSDADLERMAVSLGADCPVFVKNRPAYAEGIGEELHPLDEFLKDMWLLVVKPDLHISTREAFSGVVPREPKESLSKLIRLPLNEWRSRIKNDFEESLFPLYPELRELKEALYAAGAEYASLTGSGAALYGLFSEEGAARVALEKVNAPYKALLLL